MEISSLWSELWNIFSKCFIWWSFQVFYIFSLLAFLFKKTYVYNHYIFYINYIVLWKRHWKKPLKQLIVNLKINSLWYPAPEKMVGPRLGLEWHLSRCRASSWFCFRIHLEANHWCRTKSKWKKDQTAVITQVCSCQKQEAVTLGSVTFLSLRGFLE